MLLRFAVSAAMGLLSLASRTRHPANDIPPRPHARLRSRSAGGGSSVSSPRRQDPPLRAPGSDPRLQIVAGLLAMIVQLLAIVRWTPAGSRAHNLSSAVSMSSTLLVQLVSMVLLPLLAPRFYSRHCRAVLAVTRAVFFALPVLQDPLDVQYVLQGSPSPRFFGIVTDAFTLTLGARGLALLMAPLIAPLPLLPHLVLSAFAVQRCRTTRAMCSWPMLRHPIWRRRMAWAHRILDAVPLLAPHRPLAPLSTDPESDLHCRVFVSFHQVLLGMVLPTLLVARLNAPMRAAAAAQRGALAGQQEEAQEQDAAPDEQGWEEQAAEGDNEVTTPAVGGEQAVPAGERRRRSLQRRQHNHTAFPSGWVWKAVRSRQGWLSGAAAECEACLHHLCDVLTHHVGQPLATGLAWCMLLSLAWVSALMLEAPSLALATWAVPSAAAGTGSASGAL